MARETQFEKKLNEEINRKEAKLSNLITDKIKLTAELDTLRKSRDLYIQSRKRERAIKGEIK